jgi:hypothetical protein
MTTHSFEIEDAMRFGIAEAILIQNLRFWIQHNRANGRHEHDGRTWTFNSAKAFETLFPYMTRDQIKRTLRKLVERDVLLSRTLSKNAWDRTNWYAFEDEAGMLKMPQTPAVSHGANLHHASDDFPPSVGHISAIDGSDQLYHCTDVNADEKHTSVADEAACRPDWLVEAAEEGEQLPPIDPSAATKLAVALRAAGINCAPAHPMIQTLAERGITVEAAVAAVEYAKAGEKIGLGYVVKVLESWAKSASTANVAGAKVPAAKPKYGQWWLSDETALAVAQQVGVGAAYPHESRDGWHSRIKAAIDNGGSPPAARRLAPSMPAPTSAAVEQRSVMPEAVSNMLRDLARRCSVPKHSTGEVR